MSLSRQATERIRLLAAVVLVIVLAPQVSPFHPSRQFDPAAGKHLPPGSKRFLVHLADGRELLVESYNSEQDSVRVSRLGTSIRLPTSSLHPGAESLETVVFAMGTDRLGRDCLSRLLAGGRASLLVALLATVIAGALGILVGTAAGFAGGTLDGVLMRTVDLLLAFPPLVVVLLFASVLDTGTAGAALLLAATAWMPVARIARSTVASLRQQTFVEAAEALGCPPLTVVRRHLLPHARSPLLTALALGLGDLILLESALSFLGLGLSASIPTWGRMIADSSADPFAPWWTVVFPGCALLGLVLVVNLVADSCQQLPTESTAGVVSRSASARR